jgi:hypothetical protein
MRRAGQLLVVVFVSSVAFIDLRAQGGGSPTTLAVLPFDSES